MIAIISDIHGNYEALKKVLEMIDGMEITEIYCLGDIVGYYSQVNECCNELRERNVKCLIGNHDWYMISGTKCMRSHSVNDCLEYQRKTISDTNLKWLSELPVIINKEKVSMVHGGWINPLDEYLDVSNKKYFDDIQGRIFISGHTHIQRIYKYGNKTYGNPGSVGQPRDGDSRAAFATFDGNSFTGYRVEYDIDKVGRLMKQAGFSSYYYGCLYDGASKLHV
mgnify:CR=1 FL=1